MLLIIFESTHDAMCAEQVLLEKQIDIRMIPTPRQFSKSCGLSLLCSGTTWPEAKEILTNNHVEKVRAFSVCEVDGEKEYSLLSC